MVGPLQICYAELFRYLQIRASHSLLSIIHSMKLLLLLSDESQIANRRDAEMKQVKVEKEELQRKVAALLDALLHPQHEDDPEDSPGASQMDTSQS